MPQTGNGNDHLILGKIRIYLSQIDTTKTGRFGVNAYL